MFMQDSQYRLLLDCNKHLLYLLFIITKKRGLINPLNNKQLVPQSSAEL